MSKRLWVLGAFLLGMGWAQAQSLPTPPRKAGEPIIRSTAALTALHDARSNQYNSNCLTVGCHADIHNRTSLNRSIPPAHNLVQPEMHIPGRVCTFCHESTEIVRGIRGERGNAGKLGKNVDPERRCALCHDSDGPGKKLYSR